VLMLLRQGGATSKVSKAAIQSFILYSPSCRCGGVGSITAEHTASAPVTNRFDRMEVTGAFGDLGTLVPFVVAYISVLKMDPFGVLLAFGIAMIVCGCVYRTPMPVQPMKAAGAIATTQAAQTIVITPAMVWGANLATGVVWLLLGLTGTARYVAGLISRPVALGIILGLGFGFELLVVLRQSQRVKIRP
jgi:Molybdate transporter of MFS superfamily